MTDNTTVARYRALFFRRLARRTDPDAGLTLIETLAAIVVFGLVALASSSMLITGIKSSKDQQNRATAASVGAQQLEADRHTAIANFTSLTPPGSATFTYTVQGQTYTVTRTTSWAPKSTAAGACNSSANSQGGNTAVQPVLLVTESVSWANMGADRPITSQTTMTPPVGTYADGTGNIDVTVAGATSNPIAGATVTVVGSTTQTYTTDSRGCVFAAYLTPGNYAVTVSKAGYVDSNENATGTCAVTVSSGSTSPCTFAYDKGVTVNWQWQSGCKFNGSTLAVAACPASVPAGGQVVTVGNAGLSAGGQYPTTYTPVTPNSTLLYPYSSYGIWPGHCPLSIPSNPTTVSTSSSPSTPSPVVAALYGLKVVVTNNTGAFAVTLVTATEQASSGSTACSPTTTYTLSKPAAGTNKSTTTGMPLGPYNVVVNYTSSGTPKSTTPTAVTVGTTGSPTVTVTLS